MASHDHDATESQRILDRIDRQEGSILGSATHLLEGHLSANDADQSDKIEVWGTRIGRTIALALTFAIIAYALIWLFSN